MPGFFYFLELPVSSIVADSKLCREKLALAGLADIFADCSNVPDDVMVSSCSNRNSPTGSDGVVLYPKSARSDSPLDWGYNGRNQTWQQRGDDVGVWIGWETARPPEPEAVERREVLQGYHVYDKLDQIWHIPIARSPRGSYSIPMEFRRTKSGVERVPDRKYRDLWELSGQVHDWLYDQFQPPDQDLWKYDTAVRLLQVNYRVAIEELNLLQDLDRGVLTSATVDPILCAVVDNDLPAQLREYLAKKNGDA
jgi:hypothetical protein